ncbi:hypothetical protein N9D37_00315 [Erythrobacter sp.]|nr:hypothetical protein [Erythrobacter sp.]
MRTALLICALCASATSATARTDAYPAKAVFDAFRDGCGLIETQEVTSARLKSLGWQKIDTQDQDGALADFVAFSTKAGHAAAAAEGATIKDLEAFEKTVSDEKVYIILDEVAADGIRISGCQLYDFGEARSIPPSFGTEVLGREPNNALDRPEIQRSEWSPGIHPAHDSFKIFYVPSDSPVVGTVRFSGIALMSDTVGAE